MTTNIKLFENWIAEEEAVETLEQQLKYAVRMQSSADVPLGAFLSGGVDSSCIVALMQAQSTKPVKTFTLGFEEAGFDESPHARAVAEHLGTEHNELFVSAKQAQAVIADLPTMYDEPFAGLDPISMAVICDLIRTLNDALGATSIIVTHDVEEAFSFADYIYFIADGIVAAEGTPKELSKSKLPFVHQFVHGEKDGPVPFHYNAPSYKKDIYEPV